MSQIRPGLLIATIVFAVFAVYAFLAPTTYRTSALLVVESTGPANSISMPEPLEAGRRLGEAILDRAMLEELSRERAGSSEPEARAKAASSVRESLTIDTSDTRAFSIGYKDSNPERTQRVCNQLTRHALERAPVVLAGRKVESEDDLKRQQETQALAAFLARNPQFAAESPITPGTPPDRDPAVAAFHSEKAILERRLLEIESGSDNPYVDTAQNDPKFSASPSDRDQQCAQRSSRSTHGQAGRAAALARTPRRMEASARCGNPVGRSGTATATAANAGGADCRRGAVARRADRAESTVALVFRSRLRDWSGQRVHLGDAGCPATSNEVESTAPASVPRQSGCPRSRLRPRCLPTLARSSNGSRGPRTKTDVGPPIVPIPQRAISSSPPGPAPRAALGRNAADGKGQTERHVNQEAVIARAAVTRRDASHRRWSCLPPEIRLLSKIHVLDKTQARPRMSRLPPRWLRQRASGMTKYGLTTCRVLRSFARDPSRRRARARRLLRRLKSTSPARPPLRPRKSALRVHHLRRPSGVYRAHRQSSFNVRPDASVQPNEGHAAARIVFSRRGLERSLDGPGA